MSFEDKNRYKNYTSALVRQFDDVKKLVVSGLKQQIPQEVGIELQHMLVHLVAVGKKTENDYRSKAHEVAHALGHADRAFQDGCKVVVQNNFGQLRTDIVFMREWLPIRQAEGQRHYRDVEQKDGGGPVLEPINHCCEQFKKLLAGRGFFKSSPRKATGRYLNTDNTLRSWKAITPAIEQWMQLDLLYNSLRGIKHHGGLRVMLSSFMDLDTGRLRKLNLQMQLDTLVIAAGLANAHGWHKLSLLKHPHRVFIHNYGQITQWKETDFTEEKDWVCPLFADLWTFYLPKLKMARP